MGGVFVLESGVSWPNIDVVNQQSMHVGLSHFAVMNMQRSPLPEACTLSSFGS